MSGKPARLDSARFGPWALVTGASSGIGRGFAEQIAASKINLVLAARRLSTLDELGRELADRHGIQVRTVGVDLTGPGFMNAVIEATRNLDIGLVVSNAGDMVLGEFLASPYDILIRETRLNVDAHLRLIHHFGQDLARRGRGGLLLVSSTAAMQGVPYSANYAATKAYVLTLGQALHHEFSGRGINVTVLLPGATATPMLSRFGADRTAMGRLAMPVGTCVADALKALRANRAVRISGRMNRLTIAMTPRSARTRLFGALSKSMAAQLPHSQATSADGQVTTTDVKI
jgi:short-subunit dehydrogenase